MTDDHLKILENNYEKAFAAAKKPPFGKHARDLEDARRALEAYKAELAAKADPENRRFKTLLGEDGVLEYLKTEGWRISKSTLHENQHKIDKEKDGTWTKKAVDEYARLCLAKLDGSNDKAKSAAERKAQLEIGVLEERKKKLKQENEAASGLYELKSNTDAEFAAFAAYTKNAVGPEFIHRAVERIIEVVDGDPSRAPELIDFWLKEVEDLFDRATERGEYTVPTLPEIEHSAN